MAKFNTATTRPRATGPVTTTGTTTNHKGGVGYTRDAKSDLFLLAVTNMVSEDTYYEKGSARDQRYRALIRQVAPTDPDWVLGFTGWLRAEAGMRSASLVLAAEAVKARLEAGAHIDLHTERAHNRKIIDAACQRPDEPAELIAYWHANYGRNLPMPVKRGVADAAMRLYRERAVAKYDGESGAVRMGDVIELTHPKTDKAWQDRLFKFAIDRRHGRAVAEPALRTLAERSEVLSLPLAQRRALLTAPDAAERLKAAGITWEALAGWLQGPMDAVAWSAIIPSMGAMALVRNLRNFDEAHVPDKVAQLVIGKLMDAEEIKRSRQFPYRFLSAYREAPSLRWGHALETALAHSCQNLPELDGRTLVLVDTSGSMGTQVSGKSQMRHVDVGALFGTALAARGNDVTLCGFADGLFHHRITAGGSVLKDTEAFCARIGEVGHGTRAVEATAAALRVAGETGSGKPYRRVVLISDMQTATMTRGMWGPRETVSDVVPADVNLFAWNTSGYASTQADTSKPGRFELGGFSDKCFQLVSLLDRGTSAGWPWE